MEYKLTFFEDDLNLSFRLFRDIFETSKIFDQKMTPNTIPEEAIKNCESVDTKSIPLFEFTKLENSYLKTFKQLLLDNFRNKENVIFNGEISEKAFEKIGEFFLFLIKLEVLSMFEVNNKRVLKKDFLQKTFIIVPY